MKLPIASALLATLALACASAADEQVTDGTAQPNGPFATYRRTGEGGDDALLIGTLTMADDCLHVVSQGIEYVPVFPDVAVWDPNTSTLSLDGLSATVGSEIKLGGGELGGYASVNVPASCGLDANGWLTTQLVKP